MQCAESPLDSKEIKPVNPKGKSTLNIHWKDWCWSSIPLATWCKEPTHWKRPWCWERLKTKGERGGRGWDGWIASSTQWTWIWVNWVIVKDRWAWYAAVHEITRSQTRLSDWTASSQENTWKSQHIAWLWGTKGRPAILRIPAEEGTSSVRQVHSERRSDRVTELNNNNKYQREFDKVSH